MYVTDRSVHVSPIHLHAHEFMFVHIIIGYGCVQYAFIIYHT